MIVNLKKAILHILDANSGISIYSKAELDLTDKGIVSYICEHIDKVCKDPGLRTGDFKSNSGFMYHLNEYKEGKLDFAAFSEFAAQKLYECVAESDKITSSDLIICECVLGERPSIAVLKCDNKIGFIHQIIEESDVVRNQIVNQYAIMPSMSQRFSEYAFIDMQTMQIKYKPKKITVNGEKIDLFADGLFECDFDFSTKESFNKMTKLAKKITEEYAGNGIDTEAKIKQYVKDTAISTNNIVVEEVADAVFNNSVSAREEFIEKSLDTQIPEKIQMNEYVTKRVNKNIKILTDTGIEISFPAEYYKDGENIFITSNDDGKYTIQIDNVSQIINK